MKQLVFGLIFLLFIISALFAQEDSALAEADLNPDNILAAGMDELLSYLFLTRDDFKFRDDYSEKDVFRLAIVDSLMRQPLLMHDFADSFRVVLEGFEANPDRVVKFVTYARDTVNTNWKSSFEDMTDKQFSQVNWDLSIKRRKSNLDTRKFKKTIRPKIENIHNQITVFHAICENAMLKREILVVDSMPDFRPIGKENEFIINKYKEIILEDENYKDRTAEEMDSIQHLEEEYVKRFKEIAEDIPDLWLADLSKLFQMVDSLNIAIRSDSKFLERNKPGKPLYEIKSEFGLVAIGSYGDDVYRGDYFMIFDPGGDDSYYISYDIYQPHPTLIADYSGNDFYKAESEFALASGAFSYSFLIDYNGDDIYHGGNFSLGAGYFGVGILWDKKGNDSYFGDTFTQGAGTFGLGLLLDSEGSDNYTGNLFCQGFGFVRGFGGVVDHAGNDTYVVQGKYPESYHIGSHYQSLSQGFGFGINPYLSGGFGFLYDLGGNDAYIADYFCQGASYWWSLGILYDDDGDDKYLSHQYAQGNGTHLTLGYLRDNGGNDVYRTHSVGQGCGHDYACGWLCDKNGDDIYTGHDLVQGAGQANGIGIFTDVLGRDGYYVFLMANTQGYGNPRRDYGSIGVFFDGNGNDHYDGNGKNNAFWTTDSRWGGGLDKESIKADSTETE